MVQGCCMPRALPLASRDWECVGGLCVWGRLWKCEGPVSVGGLNGGGAGHGAWFPYTAHSTCHPPPPMLRDRCCQSPPWHGIATAALDLVPPVPLVAGPFWPAAGPSTFRQHQAAQAFTRGPGTICRDHALHWAETWAGFVKAGHVEARPELE